ncbi:hypothetical protein [Streptomyces sp. NPDC004726]
MTRDTDTGTDTGTGTDTDISAATNAGDITSFGFTVTPERVAPGETVTLHATECEVPTVTASSGVFETVTLTDGLPGTATISENAEPNAVYEVTFDCEGERGTARITVGAFDSPTGKGTYTGTGTQTPSALSKPDGGVKAGTGGSISKAGPARAVVGSVLVAGAVGGAGVLLLLRRRARNGV